MDFFTELPMMKKSAKSIEIMDKNNTGIGYIRRNYKSPFERFKNVLSFLETTNILGESDEYYLEIIEQSFKSNLTKLKWDAHLFEKNNDNNKTNFLLEDKTKISTNPQLLLTKHNKRYIFKRDFLNRSCTIYCNDNNSMCAEIRIEKLMPPSLKLSIHNDDLAVVEVLGVFYILNLVY